MGQLMIPSIAYSIPQMEIPKEQVEGPTFISGFAALEELIFYRAIGDIYSKGQNDETKCTESLGSFFVKGGQIVFGLPKREPSPGFEADKALLQRSLKANESTRSAGMDEVHYGPHGALCLMLNAQGELLFTLRQEQRGFEGSDVYLMKDW